MNKQEEISSSIFFNQTFELSKPESEQIMTELHKALEVRDLSRRKLKEVFVKVSGLLELLTWVVTREQTSQECILKVGLGTQNSFVVSANVGTNSAALDKLANDIQKANALSEEEVDAFIIRQPLDVSIEQLMSNKIDFLSEILYLSGCHKGRFFVKEVTEYAHIFYLLIP
ncbi:hypothetical protein [uncultured Microscilla sp.]|uniref:hypothetical protein n=1 Tax=uncultured Microscilla sp. TaxID=432653 RepID=UPI00262F5C61|nr:hypothetical protein [uncultured Microscilla sp.]